MFGETYVNLGGKENEIYEQQKIKIIALLYDANCGYGIYNSWMQYEKGKW